MEEKERVFWEIMEIHRNDNDEDWLWESISDDGVTRLMQKFYKKYKNGMPFNDAKAIYMEEYKIIRDFLNDY